MLSQQFKPLTGVKLAFIGLLAFWLSACASLSEEECLRSDWHQIGERDGANGYSVERLSAHQKACSKYAITIEQKAYFEGHALGLRAYCTADNAFQQAMYLSEYRYVCPVSMEPEFLRAYSRGLSQQLHHLDSDYRQARYRLDRTLARLHRVEDPDRREKLQSRAYYYRSEIDRLNSLRYRINSWLRRALHNM